MSDKGFEEVMKQNYLRTIKELVCPGCDDRLLRWPVRTCLLGHGVCRFCRDRMKLCPVCNLALIHEKSKVVDRFLKLLYHEFAKFKIDTRIKPASTKVFAKEPTPGFMQPLRPTLPPGGGRIRRRRRQNPPNPPLLHAFHSTPPLPPPIHGGGSTADQREYSSIRDFGPPPLGPPFPRVMSRQ